MKNNIICILCIAVLATFAAAAEKEFLIIGNPPDAALFDQYEQSLSTFKKSKLPSGAPFEIQIKKQLMGDQITPGMRLDFFNETYFLMLDESGKPTGLPATASATWHKGCTSYYDTVTVTASSITISASFSAYKKQFSIKKGTRIVRIFSSRQGTYIYYPSEAAFGWTSAGSAAFSRLIMIKPPEIRFNDLHLRIMKRLGHANARYDTVFSFFNTLTRQQRSVPQWNYLPDNKQYTYILDGSSDAVRQLESSTGYIVNDIERLLLGKPFTAKYHAGIITILPR